MSDLHFFPCERESFIDNSDPFFHFFLFLFQDHRPS